LGTFSIDQFQELIPFDQLPNLTWDDVLQISPVFAQVGLDSTAKINEFIDYLKVRAAGLEVTEGADVLVGTPGNDTLNGLGGNDQINGDAGDDVLLGDADNDRLFGDAGNDTLFGGDGKDKLFGGDGDDLLFGGEGIDQMNGQDGSDIHVLQLGDGYASKKGFDPSTDKLGFVKGEVRLAQLDLSTRSGSAVLAIDNDILGGTLGVGLDELTRRNVVFVKQSEVIG
jgi:Ca2+-binding RTX toxin-like protein